MEAPPKDHQTPLPKRRVSSLVVVLLILAGWWFLFRPGQKPATGPDAGPQAVVARGDLASEEKTAVEIFRNSSPAVVYITTIELRRNLFNLNIYEIPKGTGSGFIWDREGRIVTNYHVIEEANRVEVTLADQSVWKGVIVGVAPDKDLAVLRIAAPAEKLRTLPVGESRDLLVGQKVFAIGNPFGLDQTMTSGIVSALGREIQAVTGRTIQGVIQTDAAINPGNSGGPLLDSAGRLIGVNTAIYSPSGGSAGIGFAVPVDVVNRVVPEIIRHGRLIQPGLGISVAHDALARRLGVEGILVINVEPGSSAARSGLRGTSRSMGEVVLGDIIVAVNGRQVATFDGLRNELEQYRVGEEVTLTVVRDGREMPLRVVLEEVG
ncbi:MAG: trypsin-like peptidase domain-containing protein [Thermodesulfobacteriota bacterium]